MIAQLVVPGASEYERKSQRIDLDALSKEHDVRVGDTNGADIVHIYAPRDFDPAIVRDLKVPYVSNARPRKRRFRKTPEPHLITPVKDAGATFIPEAVADNYFGSNEQHNKTIGTWRRSSIKNIVEQTAARIQRYRDDVDWLLFDEAPTPDDLHTVDVWVDPAIDEDDFDGFVAEAIASGIAVVASRTAINAQRLEKGRTGILVPPRDPNELTHGILAALFKPEFRQSRLLAAQQTASKFRARHRARALIQLYESILR